MSPHRPGTYPGPSRKPGKGAHLWTGRPGPHTFEAHHIPIRDGWDGATTRWNHTASEVQMRVQGLAGAGLVALFFAGGCDASNVTPLSAPSTISASSNAAK